MEAVRMRRVETRCAYGKQQYATFNEYDDDVLYRRDYVESS